MVTLEMSLLRNGRARLALALPQHRKQLRAIKNRDLDDLFEAYGRAAKALDKFRMEVPRRPELIEEYQTACASLEEDAKRLLARLTNQR